MKQINRSIRGLGIILTLALLAGCGAATPTTGDSSAAPGGSAAASGSDAASSRIAVVATTSILADLVSNVGGERVRVTALLPAGADPHTYTPAPADVQAVAEAQVLVENGLGLEEWLAELTENAGGQRTTIVASEGVSTIEGFAHADEEHADEEHADEAATEEAGHSDEEHAEGGADPHLWFDVQRTIAYVENIRDGLKQVDPAGASTYDSGAAAYIQELTRLDAEIVQQTETLPVERRKLITNHDTFGYFAQRYGFEVVGTVFEGVSTEQDPSAQQIAGLVQQIRAENVPAIFTENTVNPRLAEQIADEAGVQVVTTLYTDALGDPGTDGDTYIKMMRYNVQQIVAALK